MNTKFFGQFLLEKGLINREQLLEALDEQRRSSPLLGDLAVEEGLIDQNQAEKINQEQRRQDKRFGDIAVSMGLLTDAQVGELLATQKSKRKYFGEILVSLGHLNNEDVDKYLAAHKAESVDLAVQIDRNFSETGLPEQAKTVREVFARFYHRMLKILVSIEGVNGDCKPKTDHLIWSQNIQAGKEYTLVLTMPAEHACFVASNFLGMELNEINELSIDAVNEFLNTFMGHIYSKLGLEGDVNILPPVFHEQQFDKNLQPCSHLLFDSGQFEIAVMLGVEN